MAHRELIRTLHPDVPGLSFRLGESEDIPEEGASEERCRDAGGTPIEATAFSYNILFLTTVSGADEGYWDRDLRQLGHNLLDCQGNWIFDHPMWVRLSPFSKVDTLQLRFSNREFPYPEPEEQHHGSEHKTTLKASENLPININVHTTLYQLQIKSSKLLRN